MIIANAALVVYCSILPPWPACDVPQYEPTPVGWWAAQYHPDYIGYWYWTDLTPKTPPTFEVPNPPTALPPPPFEIPNPPTVLPPQTIAPVTAVPEPETWALLIAGLAAVGWIKRKRK